ncbi:MAG: FAD-binding oxidoreductase [Deltaproteobacteria bacterium]|nr:FAD-binding oxidoreductase [Deltaproteobacteria bacterium]
MAEPPISTLSGWGRHSARGRELVGEDLEGLSERAHLSRGLGRSYGDSSLPADQQEPVLNTRFADRILHFDEESGALRAEAGLSLSELNRLLMPRGYFTPVSPGTSFVTLGGMVAADVHGKNQHRAGNFGDHVTALRMRVGDGSIVECSPQEHSDLFFGTIGGMGLTGHILEVEFVLRRIPSEWVWQESRRIQDIDEFQDALEEAATEWPYTMGWIDCLARGKNMGRGILMTGDWAEADEAPPTPPKQGFRPSLRFEWPSWVLNGLTIRAFNELYYRKQWRRESQGIVSHASFTYPLDAIGSWNRMYGHRGFTQYQCVLPREAGRSSARRVLEVLTTRGGASFLCVIKDFGREGCGVLSFPRPGITLALDVAVRDDTQALVDALNEQVLREGGRIYLAKDSFTRREHFESMEGERLDRFRAVRDRWDPERRFRSAQSVRLLGD